MFLFETVPRIVCLISCTPFHDPGTREMDRILFHGDPEKMRKKCEKHCQREKTCVSTNESEMLSNQNDEIAQRAGGYEHD